MTVGMLEFNIPKALSQQTLYSCGQLIGKWHTFKHSTRGDRYSFITWQTLGLGSTPRDRCIEVSNRFNNFYSRGILRTLKSGYHNKLPVICVEWCRDGRILFTMESGIDPANVLNQLTSIVISGFISGRIYNANQILTNSQTGNLYFRPPNGENIPLFVKISSGEAEMNFQYLICSLDPQDPSCP